MKAKVISSAKAKELINNANNIYSVLFVKKNGDERLMNCLNKVTKHLRGGTLNYNPESKGLKVVYDLQVSDYRMVNYQTIKKIKMNRTTYVIR